MQRAPETPADPELGGARRVGVAEPFGCRDCGPAVRRHLCPAAPAAHRELGASGSAPRAAAPSPLSPPPPSPSRTSALGLRRVSSPLSPPRGSGRLKTAGLDGAQGSGLAAPEEAEAHSSEREGERTPPAPYPSYRRS